MVFFRLKPSLLRMSWVSYLNKFSRVISSKIFGRIEACSRVWSERLWPIWHWAVQTSHQLSFWSGFQKQPYFSWPLNRFFSRHCFRWSCSQACIHHPLDCLAHNWYIAFLFFWVSNPLHILAYKTDQCFCHHSFWRPFWWCHSNCYSVATKTRLFLEYHQNWLYAH